MNFADTGAFGIKTKITLRLIEAPAVTLNASFGFATIEQCSTSKFSSRASELRRSATDSIPFYNEVMKGLGCNFEPTKRGSVKPGQIQFSLHVSIDAIDKASAEGAMAIVRDGCTSDGVELDSAVPAAFKAQPFGPVPESPRRKREILPNA